ncbi:hypothetical protein GCM10017643_16790 [Ancylobacter dichloromethanicus]|uniref:Uncharacterized protein n=1 Tax=Ancylobacter dichloromethanicus TaxID=518825 RepID=A0A9W6J8X7_9HYPH|nr:hypothetical protein GCM10017643_16790 [Ancylobacter dichloromethanicus]
MGVVVDFPKRDRAVLSDGVVQGGKHSGRRVYLIEYFDGEGRGCVVWDGLSHATALTALDAWRRCGVPVTDRVRQAVAE